ncbi:Uncharacterized protein MLTONO_p0013 (plasmid) [Mesorhizobium loti]|uniref:hypothetical protein n=1 Tax=Mesorhizobium japonicum TaxID=2066070 RepID=UPI00030BD223|nr:hypothetical protein [Mesorhizobium japonicum]BAV52483.1 Uncharacterized protein MLTONO_p0013 [Mesorhizobium loti]BCH04860.1 hypothetical protein MesoLj131b_68590 [Mesorhizobium sp. 131-2-5]
MNAELIDHLLLAQLQLMPKQEGSVIEEGRIAANIHVTELVQMPWMHYTGGQVGLPKQICVVSVQSELHAVLDDRQQWC